ncbi:MAG: YfhO family protein [Acidimicrobiia bacterium]|nr:YfhO family protein [Acidimicrobiia bacterium]
MTPSRLRELHEATLVTVGFAILTAALTAPLAFRLGAVAYRLSNGDGQFSVWNTAWVARALILHPARVFDANIFYPHTGTLVYSEANLGSGVLAVPVYWATGNVFAAHGSVVLLSFLASAVGMYYLVRYLTQDRVAATCSGIAFGFCPHVFSHLLHIQLLWTAGLPWTMLGFHRLVERPTWARGAALGLAMSATLYLCAYYAVFLVLVIGVFTGVVAITRNYWANGRFWIAMATAIVVSVISALPLLVAYLAFQRTTGFARPLGASDRFSADWQAYLASAAYAHAWLLPWLGRWNEVLFPGFIAVAFGALGVAWGLRTAGRLREAVGLYLTAGVLACWASLGPSAGLYRLLYATVPAFNQMRAPSRFGLIVLVSVVLLAGIGVALARQRWRWFGASPLAAGILLVGLVAEHIVPLDFQPVPAPHPAYVTLADLPAGAVLEVPVYSERAQFIRAKYMLASTIHWKPLVNAYSDYIPSDFKAQLEVLGGFPSREALASLQRDKVRYAVVHLADFGALRAEFEHRLEAFGPYLTVRYADADTRVYEITGAR